MFFFFLSNRCGSTCVRAYGTLRPCLCTLFDIKCCQSVIVKFVYGFMCRLDNSVKYIIKDILATSLQYTSRIRKHWCSQFYINSGQNKLYYSHYVQLHVMLDDTFIIIWTSDCYVLLVRIVYCQVWNKAIELNIDDCGILHRDKIVAVLCDLLIKTQCCRITVEFHTTTPCHDMSDTKRA